MPPRHALWLEGELKPVDAAYRDQYLAYTVVIEEFRRSGYPDMTMTLYPRLVCLRYDGCPGSYAPPASQLEVRARYQDACFADVYEAFDMRGYYDPIRSAVVQDNYGTSCGRSELSVEIELSDGSREQLTGYRTH